MQFNNYIKTKLSSFVALSFTFALASCGSYQYIGYDNDGIYSEREVVYEEATDTETSNTNIQNNSYYKNYFNEKANQYNNVPDDERVIFTDIDSYEGDYSDENQEEGVQNEYAGWGQASNNITINYIDNGWNNYNGWYGYNGWNNYYSWNGYYGWNNWRYNNWGWNAGFGYYGWGWNYGWGYYNNYWCPPGFNGYYYNNRGLAYNSGRRGSNYAYANRNSVSRRNSSTISRRSSTSSRNNSTVRRSTPRRSNSSTIRRNTTTRSNNTVRSRSNTRSNSNVTRPRSSSSTRSNTRRSTTPRSSSSSSVRSSGSSSRSSGTRSSSSRSDSSRRR